MLKLNQNKNVVIRSGDALARMVLAVWVCSVVVMSPGASAQTNVESHRITHSKPPPENRYLVVIETSRASRARLEGTLHTVYGLVGSGMRGQMRDGDTIGVWTFNDTLSTGQLGVQDWSNYERRPVAERVVTFLEAQHFEKRGKLESVVPAMLRVIKSSEFVTVILISDGGDEIHGTPFDKQINQSFKTWYSQQQDATMPFVTVLQGVRGTIRAYSVTPIPWPVDLPPISAELVAARSTPKHLPAVKPPPPPRVAPLIISGRKHEPIPSEKREGEKSSIAVLSQTTAPAIPAERPEGVPATTSATSNLEPGVIPPPMPVPLRPPAESTVFAANTSLPDQARGEKSATLSGTAEVQEEKRSLLSPVAPSETGSQRTADVESKLAAARPSSGGLAISPPSTVGPAPIESNNAAPERATFPYATLALGVVFCSAIAGMAFWFRSRRSRSTAHLSLITRSLERSGP